ncbi:MAG: hypothetical protein U1F67_26460, partial [Rubrivivax sp.]
MILQSGLMAAAAMAGGAPTAAGAEAAGSAANAAGPPPLEAFFSGARQRAASLSPDARYLAMIVVAGGREI